MWPLQILAHGTIHLDLQATVLEHDRRWDACANIGDGVKRVSNACRVLVCGCREILFRFHESGLFTRKLFPPEAVYRVIVDHADGLHESIHDGAANEFETTALEVFAHSIGLSRKCWHLPGRRPGVASRLALNKLPKVSIQALEFVLHCQAG